MWDPWIFQGEAHGLVTYDSRNGLKWSRSVRIENSPRFPWIYCLFQHAAELVYLSKKSTRTSDDTGNLKQRRYLFVRIKDILLVFMRRFLGDKILFETLR